MSGGMPGWSVSKRKAGAGENGVGELEGGVACRVNAAGGGLRGISKLCVGDGLRETGKRGGEDCEYNYEG